MMFIAFLSYESKFKFLNYYLLIKYNKNFYILTLQNNLMKFIQSYFLKKSTTKTLI